jgi:hypothetical protein
MDNAASVIENYLLAVQARVNQIIDPVTKKPVQIPDFERLMAAAAAIDTAQYPAVCMTMINNMLRRASNFDFAVPGSAVSFPADHHMHLTMGPEWYWFGCHLQVIDQSTGKPGRLSVFADMQRTRCVGFAEQRKAGWTDEQATLACSLATATVDMGPGQRTYVRRSNNTQWPLKGGSVQFSKPGEPFSFTCGADSLTGSRDVLPLSLTVKDGPNLDIALVFACNPLTGISDPEKAFFLQGAPIPYGNGGTGLTPLPTPGIYYSWPQLAVSGTVTVEGTTYAVQKGNGWIDHQLMMKSLENQGGAVHPVPFVEDSRPFDGWLWQYFNMDDLTAVTGAAFINGEMNAHPPMTYGYYLQPNGGNGWNATFVNGAIDSLWPNLFPVPCTANPPFTEATLPIVRTYRVFNSYSLVTPVAGVATPWYPDGTFDLPSGDLFAEFPADYTDMSGHRAGGVGYLEFSGFEPVAKLHAYQLDFLAKHAKAVA